MTILKNYFFVLILIFSCTCKKEETKIIVPETNNNLPQLIWHKDLTQYNNGQDFFGFPPVIHTNLVIFGTALYDARNPKIFALNKETGELVWQWSNEKSAFGVPFSPPYIYNNILVVSLHTFVVNKSQLVAIDLNTGKTIWHNLYENDNSVSNLIHGYNEFIYTMVSFDNEYKTDFIEVNINNGTSKIIKTITNNGLFYQTRGRKMYSKGDKKFIVFSIVNFNSLGYEHTIKSYDIYNFDLNEKKFRYINTLNCFDSNDNNEEIGYADENGIWFSGGKKIILLDESTANIKLDFPANNPTGWYSNIIYYNDLLIIGKDCYNLKTLKKIWQRNESNNGSNYYIFYNNKMYYTSLNSSKFHCLDLSNGQELFAMYAPARVAGSSKLGDNFQGDALAIDTANNRFYAATYKEALCFKFNP